ncbi:MAG: YqeG family HAD IIIA-type phosphatase [Clostridium sp.]|nr:YqeG family HAD IIIA-type phosphatase [Clostridium sp.]
MLERFYPQRYEVSAYVIPFDHYQAKGYKGVIFDIDNTLVCHDAPADEQALELFKRLKEMGMKTCLLSNNKEPRVKPFASQVDSPYIYKAGKPGGRGYQRAMELMGTDRENTLFVGDQLFTDVYGANRTGIYSILVRPINPKEEIQIVLKRYLEKPVLYFYKKHRRRQA